MSERASLFQRLKTTPMRDWIRGRLTGSLDWRQLVRDAGLPDVVNERIGTVVSRTRLWRAEKVDVARELTAHFADGLEVGRTPEELVRAFGDPGPAAKLIRRAKKRARPMWWKAQRVMASACLGLLAAYAILAVWFFARSPDVRRNMSAELNVPALRVPEEDRAWPLYLEVAREWPVNSPEFREVRGAKRAIYELLPGDAGWSEAVAYIENLQPQLAKLRSAAAKSSMGFVINRDDRELIAIHNARAEVRGPNLSLAPQPEREENPWLISVLLPQLGDMRKWLRHLSADVRVACEEKNASRVCEDLHAMLGMSEHVRQPALLIDELVGYAMFAATCDAAMNVLQKSPQLLSDRELIDLAHRFGAFDINVSRLQSTLDAETVFFEDSLQRMYADDGHGSGRLTAEGIKMMSQLSAGVPSVAEEGRVDRAAVLATGPLAACVLATREELRSEYLRLMSRAGEYARMPLWERRGKSSPSAEFERELRSSLVRRVRYMPLEIFVPALEKAALEHQLARARQNATCTVIACELFRRRTGAYPADVQQLVPRELPALPQDVFDGKPLRIKSGPSGLMVYSVGADGRDDGGQRPEAKSDANRMAMAIGTGPGVKPQGDWILYPPGAMSDESE